MSQTVGIPQAGCHELTGLAQLCLCCLTALGWQDLNGTVAAMLMGQLQGCTQVCHVALV